MCEDCEPNTIDCCVITYDGNRYLKNTSFKFDHNGKVDSIYSYHVPLGVSTYSLKDFLELGMTDDYILSNQKISWDDSRSAIIDNGKMIKHFQIDHEKKKITIRSNNDLIVYEYN